MVEDTSSKDNAANKLDTLASKLLQDDIPPSQEPNEFLRMLRIQKAHKKVEEDRRKRLEADTDLSTLPEIGSDEWNRECAAMDRDQDVAKKVLSAFLGIPEGPGMRYFTALSSFSHTHGTVQWRLGDLLLYGIAPRRYPVSFAEKLRRFNESRTLMDEAAKQLLSPELRAFVDLPLESKAIRAHCTARGYDGEIGSSTIELFVMSACAAQYELQHFEDNAAKTFMDAFVTDITRAMKALPEDAFLLFLNEYCMTAVRELDKALLCGPLGDSTILESPIGKHRITDPLMEDFDLALLVHDEVMQKFPHYEALASMKQKKSAVHIAQLLGEGRTGKYYPVQDVIAILAPVIESGASLHALEELLEVTPVAQREDLAMSALVDPVLVRMFKETKRYGTQAVDMRDFILGLSNARMVAGGVAGVFLKKLAGDKVSAQLIPVLLADGTGWIEDARVCTAVTGVVNSKNPVEWMKEYMRFRDVSTEKAGCIVDFVAEEMDFRQYKDIKNAFDALSDDELRVLREKGVAYVVAQLRKRDVAPVQVTRVPARPKREWQELLFASVAEDDRTFVREAYGVLRREETDHRLRYVWQQDASKAGQFVQEMFILEAEERNVLLKDSDLFKLYASQLLQGKDTQNVVEKILAESNGNPYAVIHAVLKGLNVIKVQQDDGKGDNTVSVVAVPVVKKKYGRVMIYGGQYGIDAQARIQAASPAEVRIIDCMSRKRDLPPVRQDDLVILVNTGLSKVFSGKITSACRQCGADTVPLYRTGGGAVMSVIEAYVAR